MSEKRHAVHYFTPSKEHMASSGMRIGDYDRAFGPIPQPPRALLTGGEQKGAHAAPSSNSRKEGGG